ncbi:MAG TPA: HU family DNA-binding protein [Candidatus Absconditabacterales bacterium]|nr:HU family DNA-binding protein [Candidatus Absconditabacterales bacterium]
MNLTQFVAELAAKTGLSKKAAKEVLGVVFGSIIATVKKGGEVRIQGFGTFKANMRKAREGVNPQKPSQKIKIPAMKVVSFRAGADFKKAVKGK